MKDTKGNLEKYIAAIKGVLADGPSQELIDETVSRLNKVSEQPYEIAVAIEKSVAQVKSRQELYMFTILGFILFAYKIIEVLPSLTPGLIIKLMPPAVVFVLFSILKQNPFKVTRNLALKGDVI